MDGRGGCCIARYTGGGGGAYDLSKVDMIMLRYRPIAPKPTSNETVLVPDSKNEVHSKTGRGKKRCSKESRSSPKRCSRRRKISSEENGAGSKVTLPLLPETPIKKDSILVPVPCTQVNSLSSGSSSRGEQQQQTGIPSWLSFSQVNHTNQISFGRVITTVVRSCVTVECVTDPWIHGNGLGTNDREKQVHLAKDTCPGFISDGMGKVTWTNEAYRKMVNGEEAGVMVWLVMKERPLITYPAFTCRVKVQYTCGGKERSSVVTTLPCDVWRMEGRGFAWRLDVKAALCLGR